MQYNCIVLFIAEKQHDLNVYTLIKTEKPCFECSSEHSKELTETTNLLCEIL